MTTQVTIVGGLVRDVEVKFTPSGAAVASFAVAVSKRKFNKVTSEWEDAGVSFYDCQAWRQLAENVAELRKGQRVIVVGEMSQREYETREGEKRRVWEVLADEVGVSLKFAPKQPAQSGSWSKPAPAADPWASQSANDSAPF